MFSIIIKKYIRAIFVCFKRAVFSKAFFLSFLLTTLLLGLDMLPNFLNSIYEVSRITYYSTNLVQLMDLNGGTLFLGFSFITAILSYSGVFCDDRNNHFFIPCIQRSGRHGYVVGTVTVCGVSTFLCVFFAQAFLMILYSNFVPVMDNHIYVGESSLLLSGQPLIYLFAKMILFSLRGTFFALMALMISTVVKHKYVIFSMPYILYYFLMRFGYSILNIPGMLNVRGVYYQFVFGDKYEILSVLYALLFTIVIGLITGICLSNKIRRCL